jgi:N-acetylglucosamine-6-phosphate deacetylase
VFVAPTTFPGFVDLQINGFLGTDFTGAELTPESCATAFNQIVRSGTAAFLPTLITASVETYRRNLPILLGTMRKPEFRPHVLGVHLEGPFLCPKPGAIGAHNPGLAQVADLDLYRELEALCDGELRMLTVAADAEGVDEVIREATGNGVTVSLGHQLAVEEEISRAADAGARALTHLGNGLPLSIPRHPNPIFAGLAEDRLSAMVIADGHHVPASFLKTVLRTKGVSRVVVTSDASPLAGYPPGEYEAMGHHVVLSDSGRLYDPARGNLVGSSRSMFECMNFLASLDLVGYDDLYAVGVTNPLRLIGEHELPPKGKGVRFDDGLGAFID